MLNIHFLNVNSTQIDDDMNILNRETKIYFATSIPQPPYGNCPIVASKMLIHHYIPMHNAGKKHVHIRIQRESNQQLQYVLGCYLCLFGLKYMINP